MKRYINADGLYVCEPPVAKHRPPHPNEPDFVEEADGSMWYVYPSGERVFQGRYLWPEMRYVACPWLRKVGPLQPDPEVKETR